MNVSIQSYFVGKYTTPFDNAHERKIEFNTDPDFGLAPLEDGCVICLRCTTLCGNRQRAEIHYSMRHIPKRTKLNAKF